MTILIIVYIILLELEAFFNFPHIFKLGDFGVSYSFVFLFFIYCFFFLRNIFYKINVYFPKGFIIYLLVLFLTIFPLVFNHVQFLTGSLSLLIQFTLQTCLIFVFFSKLNNKEFNFMYRNIFIFGFINCAIVYFSFFFPDYMIGKSEIQGYDFLNSEASGIGIRAFGLLGDISPWLLSLFAVFSYQNKKYLLSVFFAGSCVIGASLGASFTLVFSLVLFFLFNYRNKIYSLVITAIFFSFLMLLYNYFDDIFLFNRLKDMDNDSSSFQRSFTWLKSLDMIYESPLYGHGYGSFYYYMTYNNPNLAYSGGAVSNANNQFLQILFDGGVLLLVTYFIVIFKVMKIVKDKVVWGLNQDKYLSMKKAFYIWLLSFIISNQTMVFIIPSTIWVVLIIFVGMSYHISKYNIKDENFTLNS